MTKEKDWITFNETQRAAHHKTKSWDVREADGVGNYLGRVGWYNAWRCYAFFPQPYTVFEFKCLGRIAIFCDEQTKKHKA